MLAEPRAACAVAVPPDAAAAPARPGSPGSAACRRDRRSSHGSPGRAAPGPVGPGVRIDTHQSGASSGVLPWPGRGRTPDSRSSDLPHEENWARRECRCSTRLDVEEERPSPRARRARGSIAQRSQLASASHGTGASVRRTWSRSAACRSRPPRGARRGPGARPDPSAGRPSRASATNASGWRPGWSCRFRSSTNVTAWDRGASPGEWVRIVGSETHVAAAPIPLVRLPAPGFRIGVARILDPPVRGENR
jgi:hypothetical protein